MIGQDITPPIRQFPTRTLSRQESDLWDQAVDMLDDLNDSLVCLKMLNYNAALTWAFAQKHGLSMTKPDRLEHRLIDIETKTNRIKVAMRKCSDQKLAVQFKNGDFDIVEPSGEFGAILLVVAGIVVVAGVVTALYYYKKEADDLRPKYNALLKATDKVFCDPATPDTCAQWQAYKTDKGYTERQSVAEKIASGIGGPVKTGLQLGTAAVIAFLALIVAMRFGGNSKK